jgi:hypothetical protein
MWNASDEASSKQFLPSLLLLRTILLPDTVSVSSFSHLRDEVSQRWKCVYLYLCALIGSFVQPDWGIVVINSLSYLCCNNVKNAISGCGASESEE